MGRRVRCACPRESVLVRRLHNRQPVHGAKPHRGADASNARRGDASAEFAAAPDQKGAARRRPHRSRWPWLVLIALAAGSFAGGAALWSWLDASPLGDRDATHRVLGVGGDGANVPPGNDPGEADPDYDPEDGAGAETPIDPHDPSGDGRATADRNAGTDGLPRPVPRTERTSTPALTATDNYLLVGLDRSRSRLGGRADAIVVVVLDTSGHVGLVSVPRDLYVEVPLHGPARINATMRIAVHTGRDPLALMGRVVSDTLSMKIDHTVILSVDTFERVVDALDGIDVDVPCAINDNFHDDRVPGGLRPMRVAAGRNHLDGITAAMYVRSRHGRSDMSRARRQQAVLMAVKNRLASPSSASALPSLLETFAETVATDMSRYELLMLARKLEGLSLDHLHGVVLGHRETHPHRTVEGRAVLLPDYEAIDRSLGNLFSADAPGLQPPGSRCQDVDAALSRPPAEPR